MLWTTFKKKLMRTLVDLVILGITLCCVFGYGYLSGRTEGINLYHQLCYSGPPGIIVDETDGTVVICYGVPGFPENERKFLAPPIDKPGNV